MRSQNAVHRIGDVFVKTLFNWFRAVYIKSKATDDFFTVSPKKVFLIDN
jgi:hypothetical protein